MLALPRSAVAVVAAICALGLPGCGGDDADPPGSPSLSRPVSRPLTRLPLDALQVENAAPRRVARYVPGDERSPWRRKRDLPIPVEVLGGRPVAQLAFGHAVNLRIDAPHRTTEFDRVDVHVRVPAGQSELLRVTLFEGTRSALVSDVKTLEGTGTFETLTFLLAGIERLDVPISEVTVQVAGDASSCQIAAVEVLAERGAALLPPPGGAATLADIEGEFRRGWGLDAAVGGRTRIPERLGTPSVLHFSYSRRPSFAGVRLRVEGLESGPLELPLGSEQASDWASHRAPLAAGDAGAEVRFTLLADSHRVFTVLAELQVEPGEVRTPDARDAYAPLVLLITSDTHRGDHLSRGGTPGLVRTPALDGLGRRGVQFTDAYAAANITNPSHVALMTGLTPRDTRIVGNRAPLADAATTLAERYAAAGYATAATVSVQHIGQLFSGLGQGFDRFDGLKERADYRFSRRDGQVAVESALRWIEERRHVPLFLWVHVFDVHGPYAAPEEYEARYRAAGRDPAIPAHLDPVPDATPPAWIRDDPKKRNDVRAAHSRYRAAVDHLDDVLEPLLIHPRAVAGWTAFTGDHGESFGRHELWWTHHGLYRDQLHVPLILAGPGVPAGRTIEQPVEMIALGATLLELSGVGAAGFPQPGLDLSGQAPAQPRFALGYSGHKASISHEGWLLILSLVDHDYARGPRSFEKGATELFHVALDPACEHELAAMEPDRTERMRAALIEWLDDANDDGFATTYNLSPEAQARLTELGYAGAVESSRAGRWFVPD